MSEIQEISIMVLSWALGIILLAVIFLGPPFFLVMAVKRKFKKVAVMTGLAITESKPFSVVLSGKYQGKEVFLTGKIFSWFTRSLLPIIYVKIDGKIVLEKTYGPFFEFTVKKEDIKKLIDDHI